MLATLVTLAALTAGNAAATSAGSPATRNSGKAAFLERNYPELALQRREQGKVGFRLMIENDGYISECAITESSGFNALDEGTCDFLLHHADRNVVRASDGSAVRAERNGYINWRLPRGLTPAPRPASAPPLPAPIVCKRSGTTGSLVAKTKQCMTPAVWAEAERIARQQLERMQIINGVPRPCLITVQMPAGC